MALNWAEFEVTIEFRDRIVGGIPVVPPGADRADMYEKWARGQEVVNDPSFERSLPEALAEEEDMPVAVADVEGLETGFRSDVLGIYIEARQVKAMIREASQRLGLVKTVRGMRQVIQHDVHVRGTDRSQKLRFVSLAGEPVTSSSGKDSRPISVVTRQGPRTAIKRFEFVEEARMTFRVRILKDGVGDDLLDADKLADVLDLGCELGLGADRSQGEGTFDVLSLRSLGFPLQD